jgi:hypothetical protein
MPIIEFNEYSKKSIDFIKNNKIKVITDVEILLKSNVKKSDADNFQRMRQLYAINCETIPSDKRIISKYISETPELNTYEDDVGLVYSVLQYCREQKNSLIEINKLNTIKNFDFIEWVDKLIEKNQRLKELNDATKKYLSMKDTYLQDEYGHMIEPFKSLDHYIMSITELEEDKKKMLEYNDHAIVSRTMFEPEGFKQLIESIDDVIVLKKSVGMS